MSEYTSPPGSKASEGKVSTPSPRLSSIFENCADPVEAIMAHPAVEAALKTLPFKKRYLPAYEAVGFLQADASPLQEAILEVYEMSRKPLHVWDKLATRFRIHRQTVWRYRTELRSTWARAFLHYLLCHLKIEGKMSHIQNIEKLVEELTG